MPKVAAVDRPKLLLLGDSLTQRSWDGWVGGLAHRYQRRADVVNRGLNGYNTRWFLEYAVGYDVWNEPGNVLLTTIFFGANDASLEAVNPRQHVPLEEYKTNLKAIVSKTKESFPNSKILLIAPPPVHHEQRLAYHKQMLGDKATGILERTSESAGRYAEACKAVASELDLPVLDLFTLVNTANNGDIAPFFFDGIHFTKEGQDLVLGEILKKIETEFPQLAVHPDPVTSLPHAVGSHCEGIPSSGPFSEEVDYLNPHNSFS